MDAITIDQLQAVAADGHTCTVECVELANEDHDYCSAAPEQHWCDACKRFTA